MGDEQHGQRKSILGLFAACRVCSIDWLGLDGSGNCVRLAHRVTFRLSGRAKDQGSKFGLGEGGGREAAPLSLSIYHN